MPAIVIIDGIQVGTTIAVLDRINDDASTYVCDAVSSYPNEVADMITLGCNCFSVGVRVRMQREVLEK
jgi:hypothetical protein